MSEENVQIVKSLFAAFADRDFEGAAEVLDPSLEIRPGIVGGPEGVVYHGPDGMRRFWTDVDAAWAEFRITTEEFREIDQEVLVLGRAFAAAGAAGSPSTRRRPGWLACSTAGSYVSRVSAARRRPSQPPGCGSSGSLSLWTRSGYPLCMESSTPSRDTAWAMSEENVEVVRAAAQAWNADDMDAFRELHDPDVILRPEKNWPEPGPFIGREAVIGFYERARETLDADTVELTGGMSHAADRVSPGGSGTARGTDPSRIWT